MRIPRVDYFDPKVVHSLKSSFDDMPRIRPPSRKPNSEKAEIPSETGMPEEKRPPERTSEPTPARTPVRTPVRIRRTITRYAFEFFQDQLEHLKQFSIEEQLRGEKGSMSKMVREAIDTYLANRMQTDG